MCSASCVPASAGSALPYCRTISSRKMAVWFSCSEMPTRSPLMPILSIRKSSSRSPAFRYSGTFWWRTLSAGTSDSAATIHIPPYWAFGPEALDFLRLAIAHGRHAGIAVVALARGSHTSGSLLRRMYPPRIAGRQLVPLWKILPAPTSAITETGSPQGPGFLVQTVCLIRSAETRDIVGEIEDLLVAYWRQDFRHGAIIAATNIVFVFAQRLYEIILALIGNARNILTPRQVQTVTTVATILRYQQSRLLHARRIS